MDEMGLIEKPVQRGFFLTNGGDREVRDEYYGIFR